MGKVNSFADECEVTGVDADGNTQTGSCQEPSASAYDHHDGNISGNIDTVYRLFVKSEPNDDPKKVADGDQKIPDAGALAKMVKQRGEWVITYDVRDVAGNDAEQVQFALIMIDTQKPWFINTPTDMAGDNTLAGCDNDTTDCTKNKNYITSNYNKVETDLHIELCVGKRTATPCLTATKTGLRQRTITTTPKLLQRPTRSWNSRWMVRNKIPLSTDSIVKRLELPKRKNTNTP